MIFEPYEINGVEFKNRLLRSSMGGRSAYYDGTVNNAWKKFELRFAGGGLGGIISATINVDDRRWSPLEYPQISHDKFIPALAEGIRAIHSTGCRYIIQIGDAGLHTQTSLLSQEADQKSSSGGFDLLYGYRNVRSAMTLEEIERTVQQFGQAARRTRDAGADGVEVTVTKGYLIHQFLNPAINRRTDRYGGSFAKRFQLAKEIITEARKQVGPNFILGVRISGHDTNYLPVNLRLPVRWPLRDYIHGNASGGVPDVRRLAARPRGGLLPGDERVRLHQPEGPARPVPDRRDPHVLQLHAPPFEEGRRPGRASRIRSRNRSSSGPSGSAGGTGRARTSTTRGPSRSGPAPGHRQRRLPAPLGDRGRAHIGQRRPRVDGPGPPGQPGSATDLRGGPRGAGTALYPLQPMRRANHAVPAGLLRAGRFDSPEAMEAQILEWSGQPNAPVIDAAGVTDGAGVAG